MSEWINDLPRWKPGLGSTPDIMDYQKEIDAMEAEIVRLKEDNKTLRGLLKVGIADNERLTDEWGHAELEIDKLTEALGRIERAINLVHEAMETYSNLQDEHPYFVNVFDDLEKILKGEK